MKRAPILKAYAIFYMVFLYGPILLLPIFAFNDSKIMALPLQGFTLGWFREMWSDQNLWLAAQNSLIIALSVATLSTVLGIFAARASVRYDFPAKVPIMGLIMLPLVLPEMIIAMALLVVLLSIGIPLSLFTVILGQVLICTPFAVAILTSAFQSLDKSLEEAALDLGETQWSTFRLITLPLVMPGIMASFLICFIISFDEYIIAQFLSPGDPILSTYIFAQFKFPAKVPSMLALGTVLVLFSIILLGVAEYFRRRGIARVGGKDSGGFL
jgi:spermidine/putrescine transport system permease protein